jgi:hypothetical protein
LHQDPIESGKYAVQEGRQLVRTRPRRSTAMRRSLLVLLLTTVVLGLTAASAAAQTLDITFHTALTKPQQSTCEAVFCAPVSVPGYGEGTLTFTDESFEQISRSCAEYTGTARIEFVDADIAPIVMAESGLVCFPGNSLNAPGGFHSFGNPFHQTGTFVVEEGPAELLELTGTSDISFAGAALQGVYTIELE